MFALRFATRAAQAVAATAAKAPTTSFRVAANSTRRALTSSLRSTWPVHRALTMSFGASAGIALHAFPLRTVECESMAAKTRRLTNERVHTLTKTLQSLECMHLVAFLYSHA